MKRRVKSVFRGDVWMAYKPGQDVRFKENWVTRDRHGSMCSVLNSRKDLVDNARMNQVDLVWSTDQIHKGVKG